MRIVIPSINRWNSQPTLAAIPPFWHVTLVVPEAQSSLYARYANTSDNTRPHTYIAGHPMTFTNIGEVRHWILQRYLGEHVLMMDDDLAFFRRRHDEPDKFKDSTPEDMDKLLEDCMDRLHEYAHIAVATREGGNRVTSKYNYVTRGLRILGYNTNVVLNTNTEFNRIPVMEDFDVTLQLLRKGYANCIINWMVHNQVGGSGATGGCSTYRTLDMQAKAAHKLAELHPDFVTVVKKKTKTAWGGAERTDVRIQWKKAYESSGRNL